MSRLKAHHEQALTPAGNETVKLIRQTRQAIQKRYPAEEKIRIVVAKVLEYAHKYPDITSRELACKLEAADGLTMGPASASRKAQYTGFSCGTIWSRPRRSCWSRPAASSGARPRGSMSCGRRT